MMVFPFVSPSSSTHTDSMCWGSLKYSMYERGGERERGVGKEVVREREFGEIIAHGEVAVQSHNFN